MSKKRRKTKHRGNAAGMVEARGRTSAGAGRPGPAAKGRGPRPNRFDQPPTWRSATIRAGVAALLFVVLLTFIEDFGQALALGAFVFLLYIPLGFYTDLLFFRRRQAKLRRQA